MKLSTALSALALSVMLVACSDDEPKEKHNDFGLADSYSVSRMQALQLYTTATGTSYTWHVKGPEGAVFRAKGDASLFNFVAITEGHYEASLTIDGDIDEVHNFTIDVDHEKDEYSPNIAQVHEYCPAPGQFVNTMPEYEEGDTHLDMCAKCLDCIGGTNDEPITLGGFGGYVTFSFDHSVVNVSGEKDIRLWGNTFRDGSGAGVGGGSSEPGIVMVSIDANLNCIPDDPWYELAGSEYHSAGTVHNYEITYFVPDPNREIVTDTKASITDRNYILWMDNKGETGYVSKNMYHSQDYYPAWVAEQSISFAGTRLAPNAEDVNGDGSLYVLHNYEWGYADNYPNTDAEHNSFDISWAVDENGKPVDLPYIDFVRVYTGINQYCGWIGETSTEISRAADLHLAQ